MLLPTTSLEPAPGRLRTLWPLALAGIALLGLYGFGLTRGGELAAFLVAGVPVLPFVGLAVLAYGGERQTWGRLAAGAWLLALAGGFAFGALVLSSLGGSSPPDGPPGMVARLGWLRYVLILGGLGLAGLAGALAFVPQVRRALARWLPLDPDSFVHTVALAAVIALTGIGFVPLIVLGAPPLLAAVDRLAPTMQNISARGAAGQLRDALYGLLWTVPGALLAVGYGLRRRLPAALERLGLVRPTRRQVLGGLALAVVGVLTSALLDAGVGAVWAAFGWPRTDGAALGALLDYAISPMGAVVLGLTAGLGEELVVRGVLQPRLGILLSNLLFTSLHAFQYNWDALLPVFCIGLGMGLLRRRTNTTTTALVHGTYDFLLIMAAVLQVPGFS